MIPLKSERDLEIMRQAGKIIVRIMQQLQKFVKPGVSTQQIDELAEELCRREDVLPAFKGYKGFPATICVSINDEIVHGIPSQRVIKEGDIVSLDMGINLQGYFSDIAVTLSVGEISAAKRKLVDVTRKALAEGIKEIQVDNHLSNVSWAIQNYVEKNGFSVVRQFVGHGIGRNLHEEPEVPNFGRPNQGLILKKGMVLAVEPMVNMGTWESEILENGWTAVTKDGMPSAHFEHTVAVTQNGPQILTN